MELDDDKNIETNNHKSTLDIEDFDFSNENSVDNEFCSGVVEGFYGDPWSNDERDDLFFKLQRYGLNSYIYAPKDDLKHRKKWRSLYDSLEMESLEKLILSCKERNVNFIYTISPGLDIVYSCADDRKCLLAKFKQLIRLGCCGFGLFFDDINPDLGHSDSSLYNHYSAAHIDLTNYVFEALGRPKHFFFCPTEYCSSQASPNLSSSLYLKQIGLSLNSHIYVMWTGPRVISRTIPVEHLRELCKVIKRKPVIWDNLHANDYDTKQVFLGPYSDRPLGIYPYVSGIFLNPNCQFQLNFIPIISLQYWLKEAEKSFPLSNFDENNVNRASLETYVDYDSQTVFVECCKQWLHEFSLTDAFSTEVDSDYNDSDNSKNGSPENNNCLSLEFHDVYRVASFYYLPGKFGKFTKGILRDFAYIKFTSTHYWQAKINQGLTTDKLLKSRRLQFKRTCDNILKSIKNILVCQNQSLKRQITPYALELRSNICTLKTYVQYLERRELDHLAKDLTSPPDTLMGISRFSVEVEKLLPTFTYDEFLNAPHMFSPIYVIRIPNNYDKDRLETVLYSILRGRFGIWDDLRPSKELSTLKYLATFFKTDHKMWVIEDSDGLCGYMLYKNQTNVQLEETIKDEYNNYILSNYADIIDHTSHSFMYPPVVPSIFKDYPLRLFLCFQEGFKKVQILHKLFEMLINEMKDNKIKGVHLYLDAFELVDASQLLNHGFRSHPECNFNNNNNKYYVLDMNID